RQTAAQVRPRPAEFAVTVIGGGGTTVAGCAAGEDPPQDADNRSSTRANIGSRLNKIREELRRLQAILNPLTEPRLSLPNYHSKVLPRNHVLPRDRECH